jgi:hypothetical protein
MVTWSKANLSKAYSPNAWCIRAGDDGGLKLTYNQVITKDKVSDIKKTFKTTTQTQKNGSMFKTPRGCISQGFEIQIIEWTSVNNIIYVSNDSKIYKLLMMNAHGKREDSNVGLQRKLTSNTKIQRIHLD